MVAIACGLWLDYSKPSVLAATVTLPVNSGTLLISGLTLLVTFAGASFWNIFAFLLHHQKSAAETTSIPEAQILIILRNSAGAIRTLLDALKIHQAWSKRQSKQLLARTCTVVVPAILIPASFAVAGLFASAVANKSYGAVIARVEPSNCGFWIFDSSTEGMIAQARKIRNDTTQARSYISTFYANASASTIRSMFIQSALPYKVNDSAPCPIPAVDRCIPGPNKAFRIDTDLLDSRDMLGVNAKVRDRISLQMSLTCSPVNVSDLSVVTTNADYQFIQYFLGPIVEVISNTTSSNSTYHYNTLAGNNSNIGYSLSSVFAYAETPNLRHQSPWTPIPDFNRTDADVSVHFLNANDIRYMGPSHDPWFSANRVLDFSLNTPIFGTIPMIKAESWVSTMVCADQYILCNPSTSVCTPPGGLLSLNELVWINNSLELNAAQRSTAGRVIGALAESSTFGSVETLGPAALWANNEVAGVISPALPDNQWQTEVLGWFQTSLANVQWLLVEFASSAAGLNPSASASVPSARRVIDPPNEAKGWAYQDQCTNQLVQAVGEYQNFSLCGVLVIVCVSATIILLDWSLEWLVDHLGERNSVPRLARQANGRLHLLRMALGGLTDSAQGWKVGKWSVPVRDDDMTVGRLASSNGLSFYGEKEQSEVAEATKCIFV